MMARRFALLSSVMCLATAIGGCGPTVPSRFYTLGSTAAPGVALNAPTAKSGINLSVIPPNAIRIRPAITARTLIPNE